MPYCGVQNQGSPTGGSTAMQEDAACYSLVSLLMQSMQSKVATLDDMPIGRNVKDDMPHSRSVQPATQVTESAVSTAAHLLQLLHTEAVPGQ